MRVCKGRSQEHHKGRGMYAFFIGGWGREGGGLPGSMFTKFGRRVDQPLWPLDYKRISLISLVGRVTRFNIKELSAFLISIPP